jgi:hypothetical protein
MKIIKNPVSTDESVYSADRNFFPKEKGSGNSRIILKNQAIVIPNIYSALNPQNRRKVKAGMKVKLFRAERFMNCTRVLQAVRGVV